MSWNRFYEVQDESSELDLKLGDLLAFIDSREFNGLSIGQRALLKKQSGAMMDYQHVLFARLHLLREEIESE